MSDFNYAPPPPRGSSPDNKSRNIAIAAVVVAAALGGALFGVTRGGGSGSSGGVADSVPAATAAPVATAPAVNKYDQYYEHVLNNSGKANSMSKSDVIELGDLVCESLDDGNSIRAVVAVLSNASRTTRDMELSAAVMYGAITYICDEYQMALSAYLNDSN